MNAARTPDGVALRYTLRGDPKTSGPRIVLVHSLALSRYVWEAVAERLAAHAAVLTYDARGHGESDKPQGPYSVQLFADDLAALLDGVGWSDADVAGCSMGGSVALGFATSYPDRVRTLGLFDTTAWYGPDAEKAWDERAERARKDGLASLIAFQQTRWFGDAFRAEHPDVVQRASEIFLANDINAYAATSSMLGRFDLRAKLGTIRVPTAILVGEEDYATPPAMAQVLHEGIAGSTLDVIPGARHITPLQIPEVVASALESLIARERR
jgi:3-oxoadipate enol-lactonase